ncbi:amidohydrolase [Streptomyces cavourensis]|nr:amidohydrolase [Streptomyces cavourensis]
MQLGFHNNGLWEELRSIRQDIHSNPEFGFEENRTSGRVAALLRAYGLDVTQGVGGTGVVGTLKRGSNGKAIIFRADMDALQITEAPDANRPHISKNCGYMHACGHDGHTAMLLGAAQVLAQEGGFDGTIHFVFQPAEEWGKGMLAMLEDGLLERFPATEAYGLHNQPGLPVGKFETRPGPFKSAEDNFEIRISGKGVHSSRPHQGRDALVAAAAVIMALQTIVSRVVTPGVRAIVSCTDMTVSGTRNVSSGHAHISGDCRSYSPEVSALLENEIERIAQSVAHAYGCSADVEYSRVFVPTVNDEALTREVSRIFAESFGDGVLNANATPGTGSEDFAQLLQRVPGCYLNIGNGQTAPLHNPEYDFNDDAIPHGVKFFVAIARDRLASAKNRVEMQ